MDLAERVAHLSRWRAPGASVLPYEALTPICAGEILEALGLSRLRLGRRLLEWLCQPAARRMARQLAVCDSTLGERGLHEGGLWILHQFAARLEVAGQQYAPSEGPLLIVANHPGLTDAPALFASLPRSDLRIVAADYPLLRALRQVGRHLIYMPEQAQDRASALRQVIRHLRGDGAILLFPAGRIEPDPAVLPGAVQSLADWSPSIGLLLRLAPRTQVMPAIISGVLSGPAQRHPLTRLRRHHTDRERLGTLLQVLVSAYQTTTVRVAFGPPLRAEELLAASADGRVYRTAVEHAQRLIEEPPTEWQLLVADTKSSGGRPILAGRARAGCFSINRRWRGSRRPAAPGTPQAP